MMILCVIIHRADESDVLGSCYTEGDGRRCHLANNTTIIKFLVINKH